MHELERLSALIGDIYDAALDPTLWVGVLDGAARFVGGPAASLYSKDIVHKTGNVAYQFGLDPRFTQLYVEKYIKFEPTAIGYFMAPVGEPVSTSDVMSYDDFIETRFYKEWGRPQGLVDTVHVMLEKSATSSAAFVVFRHERDGLVDNDVRNRMRLVIPHLRRAALIGKVLDLKKTEAATFADTLDGISAGMFLVDATGRIAHANVAGLGMLNAADVLRARGARLAMNDPQFDQVEPFSDGLAEVQRGDWYGLIDKAGQFVWGPTTEGTVNRAFESEWTS